MVKVFVYGTLRAGEINDIGQVAERFGLPAEVPAPRCIGHGTVRGQLFDCGPYPALVPDEAAPPVRGDIYEVDPVYLGPLDIIEEIVPGERTLYSREVVHLPVAGVLEACFYYPADAELVRQVCTTERTIEGGDWIRYRMARAEV